MEDPSLAQWDNGREALGCHLPDQGGDGAAARRRDAVQPRPLGRGAEAPPRRAVPPPEGLAERERSLHAAISSARACVQYGGWNGCSHRREGLVCELEYADHQLSARLPHRGDRDRLAQDASPRHVGHDDPARSEGHARDGLVAGPSHPRIVGHAAGAVVHVVGGIGDDQVRGRVAQAPRQRRRGRGVALEEAVGAQLPAGAGGDPAGLAVDRRQRLVQVEPLRPGPFLPLVEAGQQVLEIGLGEAAQRQVPVRRGAQVDQQAGEQVFVPLPADLVQGDVEQPGVRLGEVDQNRRHRGEPAAPRGDQPLVAGDDAPVGAPREKGIDEPKRLYGAAEGRQLSPRDAAGIEWIGVQVRDR